MLKKTIKSFKLFLFRMMFNLYPPYLGAGIRINYISHDYTTFDVRMKLTFYNKNYFGTHFGGSLYSMCDPFFTIILIKNLGNNYIVWDKHATIRFKKPGRDTVKVRFHIPQEKIREIKHLADINGKTEPVFTVDLTDKDNNIIAQVEKTVYVRKKTR
jgi:acyl-coenzyme A thioesterase PaaI-like protein